MQPEPFRLEIPDCPDRDVALLERELDVSAALAQVLVRRGLREPQCARTFLEASERHPPEAFAGMRGALELVTAHIAAGSRITVHGDYDVDGVCATAVLVRALRTLGADVDHFLPDRAGDGYGLSAGTVERLAARGTKLLITVDCAITAVAEVARARGLGLDVLVTDHHTPRADGALPDAPIVHPSLGAYPCRELCATAVAYKLACALHEAHRGRAAALEEDLDLVALATIADVVPLVGENRALARRGLRALASTRKPGLRALMALARVDASRVDERAVGFALAPRLNAAGRMQRADAGLELILTQDAARAQSVAEELDRANHERRAVERRIMFAAEEEISKLPPRSAYVLAQQGWHAGVIGIVASRLAERHRRPVVLVALDGDGGRGSGRSIPGFDLHAGLAACSEHLRRYGGHRAAAGLEVERGRLQGFAAALNDHAERVLCDEDTLPVERVDALVTGPELSMALAEELQSMAPFGMGNPSVSLLVKDACFGDRRPMGEGRHVRFTVSSHGARARAVAFGTGAQLPVSDGEPAQATFALEVNEWRGVSEPRLVLRRARPDAALLTAARDRAPPSEDRPAGEQESAPAALEIVARRGGTDRRSAGERLRPRVQERPQQQPEDEELVLFALE
ncbi:MAG TPA: single-stranded-DNA-specific exonuclease RecJ [Solirubrobacteraceae bacterium]|nr:single-stranded-DNA-specific exonuclease RecJ [Solirubrobacteraceae bacterium]